MPRLTPRGRLVAWLAIGYSVSAWVTGASILLVVGAIGTGLLLSCYGYSLLMTRGISGTRRFVTPAYEGESLRVEHTIRNDSSLTKGHFHLVDGFWTARTRTPSLVCVGIDALRPGQPATLEHTVRCFKRGEYRIPPAMAMVEDPLGLWCHRCTLQPTDDPLLVYPELLDISDFPVLASGADFSLGLETSRVSGDHQEFFGVREYRPGDSPRRIHWLSTVRQQRLITKEFERGVSSNVTILLDLHREHDLGHGRHSTLEYSVLIAAALARYLLDRGEGVQLIGYGDRLVHIPLSRGVTQWYRVLEQLALVRANGDVGLTDAAGEYEMAIAPDSVVVTFLLDREERDAVALTNLCAKGARLFAFVFRSSSFLPLELPSRWATRMVRAEVVLESVGAYVIPVECRAPLQQLLQDSLRNV